jgi:Bacterial protein of unknown function (DUF899)
MTMSFPGESTEYRSARDRLLDREIELRREMEAVAAARRNLPLIRPLHGRIIVAERLRWRGRKPARTSDISRFRQFGR